MAIGVGGIESADVDVSYVGCTVPETGVTLPKFDCVVQQAADVERAVC